MNNIELIESTCAALAKARAELRKKHEAKLKEQRVLDAKHNDGLRSSQQLCGDLRATLLNVLENSRAEFTKPKSREFSGITVGFEKQRGSVTMPDEKILVQRIEQLLPKSQAETLLDRSVSIIKAAFKKLPTEILQKLGCNVVSGADKAVVRANDDDIETLVQKSLGEAEVQS
jgi:hypothetical protein